MPLNQQTYKGVTVLSEVIDADHQGEIGLSVHNRGVMAAYVWNRDPLRHPLVIAWPVIKLNGKL